MYKNINVEAENLELILENSNGDKVIIPAKRRDWVKKKLSDGCHECIDRLVDTLPIASQYAQDGSVYPPGKKIKVNQNNQIKEYDINSNEYKDLYNSGKLMNYDENTDTYVAVLLKEVKITAESLEWAKDKNKYESKYSKDWYIDNNMPKFSRNIGVSANNMHKNTIKEYDNFINNKVVEDIFKRKLNFDSDYSNDRIKTLESFTEKELELIKNSSYSNKIEPSIWSKFEQGLLSVGNIGSPVQFKNTSLSQEEAKNEDNPLNIVQPLSIPSKMVQSTYKDNYSFNDALSGKQNKADIIEDLITDLLSYSPFVLSKLSKVNKLNKISKVSKIENQPEGITDTIQNYLRVTENPLVNYNRRYLNINNLTEALDLSDYDFSLLQNSYRNNPNYFNENNIIATESALNSFNRSANAREFENSFLNIPNNFNITNLNKSEKIVHKIKKNISNFGKELDLHMGEIINPKQSVDRVRLENDINSILKKGVGIKKEDIPIQVKAKGNLIKVYLDPEKNGKFLESGVISVPEEGLEQKTLSKTLSSLFKKEHKGVQKASDFPTQRIGMSGLFNGNINVEGVGGEIGEAIKQSLKQQNKNWNLLSSKFHTDKGSERYLTEFLNNRKVAIDVSENPEWLKIANETKLKYPNGIKKSEVIELLKENPKLRPNNIKFAYSLIPVILGAKEVIDDNQNKPK